MSKMSEKFGALAFNRETRTQATPLVAWVPQGFLCTFVGQLRVYRPLFVWRTVLILKAIFRTFQTHNLNRKY